MFSESAGRALGCDEEDISTMEIRGSEEKTEKAREVCYSDKEDNSSVTALTEVAGR